MDFRRYACSATFLLTALLFTSWMTLPVSAQEKKEEKKPDTVAVFELSSSITDKPTPDDPIFGSVGGEPLFIVRADGAWITDADGNAYLDFVGSWGPMILGHNQEGIRKAVYEALRLGTSFGAPTTGEIELAELVVE